MRTCGVVLAAVALVFALDAPASAQRTEPPPGLGDPSPFVTTLIAGPLEGAGFWQCNVLNIGQHLLHVHVEIHDLQGVAQVVDPASQTCDEPVLPAHICRGPAFGDQGRFSCAVRFFGNAHSVRATLQLTNDAGHSLSAEAR